MVYLYTQTFYSCCFRVSTIQREFIRPALLSHTRVNRFGVKRVQSNIGGCFKLPVLIIAGHMVGKLAEFCSYYCD